MNTNKLNAQNDDFFSDLHEALDRLDAEHPQAPVVLTGTGTTFSAGLELNYTFGSVRVGHENAVNAGLLGVLHA